MKYLTNFIKGYGLIALQVLLLLSLVIFSFFYHKNFQNNITEKYSQQLSNTSITARLSVLSYFEKFSENLINLSHHPDVKRMTKERGSAEKNNKYCPMEKLFNLHKHEIDALILMDTFDLVIKRIANDTMDLHHMMCIGNPVANPNVPEDSVYFSDIFINHKNQKAITISCPVYFGEVKTGILRWMITIESINIHFLHAINHEKHTHFVITDDHGRLLSNTDTYVSWLCTELCKCDSIDVHRSIIRDYKSLSAGGSGKVYLKPYDCCVYAAWNPFRVGEKLWNIFVMMPSDLLDNAILRHGIMTFILTGLAITIMLTLTIIHYTTRLKQSRLETEAKYLGQIADTQKQLKEEREKRLSAQISGQESERYRISRELHDGLGQLLLTMRLKLKKQSENDYDDDVLNKEIEPLLNETIDEVKRISDGLSPVILLELGIEKALSKYAEVMSERSGVKVEFVSFGIPELKNMEINTHLFRIAQESLTNALRHGNPGEVNIQLLGSKTDKITLIIQDDGEGFEYNEEFSYSGNGIDNIRDRVSMLSGSFKLESTPGQGTTVIIKIDVKNEI